MVSLSLHLTIARTDTPDLEQLLHMLSDSSRPQGQMVRCTKARAMFAMRACRKSVMIGKSLTKAQMITVRQLGYTGPRPLLTLSFSAIWEPLISLG